jgi:tetratricopeptide (TPR) repeat protein
MQANMGEREKALESFYEALLYDDKSVTIYLAISENLIALKRLKLAEINLKKALNIEPDHYDANEKLGTLYFLQGKDNKALKILVPLFEKDPSNKRLFQIVLALYDKNYDKKSLLAFIEKNKNNVDIDENMSLTIAGYYLNLNDTESAKKWLKQTLKMNPENIRAKVTLGRLKIASGEKNEGLSELNAIAKENPENKNIIVELVEAYRQEKNTDAILQLISSEETDDLLRLFRAEALYHKERNSEASDIFATIPLKNFSIYFELVAGDVELRLKNYESAFAFFRSITERAPRIAEGYHGAAFVLIQQKRYLEAEDILRTGIVKAQDNKILQPVLAETLIKLNKFNEANSYLERLLEKYPNDLNTIMQAASAYQEAKNFQKSDMLFEKAIKMDNENVMLLNNYSYSLAVRGVKLEYALKLIKKALQKEPNNGYYLDTIGWIYYKMGDYRLAKKFIQKSIDQRGEKETSAEVLEHMGDVYKAFDELENAKKYWKLAFEKDSDNSELKKKIESH